METSGTGTAVSLFPYLCEDFNFWSNKPRCTAPVSGSGAKLSLGFSSNSGLLSGLGARNLSECTQYDYLPTLLVPDSDEVEVGEEFEPVLEPGKGSDGCSASDTEIEPGPSGISQPPERQLPLEAEMSEEDEEQLGPVAPDTPVVDCPRFSCFGNSASCTKSSYTPPCAHLSGDKRNSGEKIAKFSEKKQLKRCVNTPFLHILGKAALCAAKTQAELMRKWMVLAETTGEGIRKEEGLEPIAKGTDNGLVPTAKAPRWRELHQAARNGDLRLVKQLLQRGASTNSRDENGWTLLHVASLHSYLPLVKFLIQHGATVHTDNMAGYTPLHHAAWSGHTQVAELLLARGAPVMDTTKGGLTPFHFAAANGHTLMIQLLLRHGTDPDASDCNQWTSLHWATAGHQLHIMNGLISQGVNPNLQGKGGIAPLHIAAEIGRAETIRLLLAKGADVNLQDDGGRTALSVASKNSHHEMVKLLLQNQADRNLADSHGCTPLHKAAAAGSLPSVRLLLQGSSPACVTQRDGLLLTPLHRAVLGGHAEVAGCLLEHGADVDAAGWLGKTALHLAAENKFFPLMEFLIAKSADFHRKTWWNETAEDLTL
ncbi:ankyrin repeat domain-containing protein 65 [Pituophis catenifer annectens]|uniref:ankyrin repeat domain-containing protein 65 n=1 Tax=Pituophis catenifer annectens TaxID=94852 RepID=UPI00399220E4